MNAILSSYCHATQSLSHSGIYSYLWKIYDQVSNYFFVLDSLIHLLHTIPIERKST